MSFDIDPRDYKESYPCPCGGSIVKNNDGNFECDSCDLVYQGAQ